VTAEAWDSDTARAGILKRMPVFYREYSIEHLLDSIPNLLLPT
jgi:hypothetical protein